MPADAHGSLPRVAPAGLSRARLYAFHAAVTTGVAATACGSSPPPATAADAALDRGGVGGEADASTGRDAGADTSAGDDATGTSDAANDAVADATADAPDATDADLRDWGPIPPPYGCVFPEGDEVTV